MLKSLKLLCSLLLVICICLPLSQCSGPVAEGDTGPAPLVNLYLYGETFEITDVSDVLSAVVWLTPALLALVTFRSKPTFRAMALQLVAILAAAVLWLRLFMLSEHMLWAGYLAGGAISITLALVVYEFVAARRQANLPTITSS